jgi:hypothetical protein
MRLGIPFACLVCLGNSFAQSSATLDAIRYNPLAAAARIKGDVLISGGNAVTGPPLLRGIALRDIDVLNFRVLQTDVLFHFILSDIVLSTRIETIKKGDAFGRFFLRLFGIPTTRKIATQVCTEGPDPPANRIDSTRDPVEVWVYGKARCLMAD